MELLKVKLNLSTVFHPQTDGQSEHAFRTPEEMLRCIVDRSRFFPGIEFAYNNHMNVTTNHTPFFLEHGQNPLSISDILQYVSPEATCTATANFLSNIRTATALAQNAIQQANDRNTETVKKTKKDHEYEVRNQVMLLTKKIPLTTRISQNISSKYIDPFTLTQKLASGFSYRLNLPVEYEIHPVFHISLLKPY